MKFKDWVIDLFKDERGAASVKPVLATLGAIVLCTVLLIDTISRGDVKFSDALTNSVLYLTIFCLGADTADKFSFKNPK